MNVLLDTKIACVRKKDGDGTRIALQTTIIWLRTHHGRLEVKTNVNIETAARDRRVPLQTATTVKSHVQLRLSRRRRAF